MAGGPTPDRGASTCPSADLRQSSGQGARQMDRSSVGSGQGAGWQVLTALLHSMTVLLHSECLSARSDCVYLTAARPHVRLEICGEALRGPRKLRVHQRPHLDLKESLDSRQSLCALSCGFKRVIIYLRQALPGVREVRANSACTSAHT